MSERSYSPSIVYWEDLDDEYGFPNADPSLHKFKFLAEGDSWFSIGGFPISNLLQKIRLDSSFMIVNCGFPGDTMKNMSDLKKNKRLVAAIDSSEFSWDAILLSGGGNDLIDKAKEIILDKDERKQLQQEGKIFDSPDDYCNLAVLNKLLKQIQKSYQKIAELRDRDNSYAKNKPIIVHTYDYSTPRNSPAKFLSRPITGPWLYDAIVEEGEIDNLTLQKNIADFIIDRLAEALLDLQNGNNEITAIANFHVVDTRGTLERAEPTARGNSNDWLNEIHPNEDGYEKIAHKVSGRIHSLTKIT